MKKVLFILLICTLLISSIALAKEFPDVDSSHWAYQYINELSNQGVINGYEDGTFRPNGTVTRAEFLKLVISCMDKEKYNEFAKDWEELLKEVEAPWYMIYYEVGRNSEICTPKYYKLDVNSPASREEMVELLFSYCYRSGFLDNMYVENKYTYGKTYKQIAYELKYIKDLNMSDIEFTKKYDKLTDKQKNKIREELDKSKIYTDEPILNEVIKYKDLDELSNEQRILIEFVLRLGLLNGYEDKTFRLDNNLTRAEATVIIHRLLGLK